MRDPQTHQLLPIKVYIYIYKIKNRRHHVTAACVTTQSYIDDQAHPVLTLKKIDLTYGAAVTLKKVASPPNRK